MKNFCEKRRFMLVLLCIFLLSSFSANGESVNLERIDVFTFLSYYNMTIEKNGGVFSVPSGEINMTDGGIGRYAEKDNELFIMYENHDESRFKIIAVALEGKEYLEAQVLSTLISFSMHENGRSVEECRVLALADAEKINGLKIGQKHIYSIYEFERTDAGYQIFPIGSDSFIPQNVTDTYNGKPLSEMTYDEFLKLKEKINLYIWESEEWEEVTVPQGIWQVGVDIPAGHWTVKCAPGWRNTEVHWGQSLSSSGQSIAYTGRYSMYNSIYNPNHKYYEVGDGITEYDFEVRNGDYIIIDDGSCIFAPYSGKQSLGFKALNRPGNGQAETKQNSQPNTTEKTKNSEYQPFDYKTYSRNPENYINQKYELNGEIIQVTGSRGNGYGIRLSTDDYSNEVVWVKISFDPGYSLLDGDVVTICAKANNMFTYETIFGATLTIPYFIADSIEIIE